MQENNNQLQKNILEKIKSGQVQMTSRRYFVLKWLTLGVTSVFFLILGIYIFAYVVFLFVDNGLMIIPFGAEGGILKLIIEVPWTLVVLGLVSLFLFSITSKTFYKIYKKPLISFYFTILICVVLSHIILLEVGTMDILKKRAYNAGFSLVPSKLLQYRDSQTRSIFIGQVIATSSDSLTILDRWNNLQILYFDPLNIEIANQIMQVLPGQKINAYVEKVSEQNQIKSLKIVN